MVRRDIDVSVLLLMYTPSVSHTTQPPMSGSRLEIIGKAFLRADKTGDGQITIDDLKG